jgi:hypothetical protein
MGQARLTVWQNLKKVANAAVTPLRLRIGSWRLRLCERELRDKTGRSLARVSHEGTLARAKSRTDT